MLTLIKKVSISLILLSLNSFAENFVHEFSDDVNVKFSQSGLVSINSSYLNKTNHHFNFKLNSMGYGENLLNFSSAKTFVLNNGIPTFDWGNGITEEWKISKNSLQLVITINERPIIEKSNNEFVVSYLNNTDLEGLCVGDSCYYSDIYSENSDSPANNLKIDANTFAVTDDNCKQLNANNFLNYQDKTMKYSFDNSQAKYPISIKHTINVNMTEDPKTIKAIAVDNNNLAVSYINNQKVDLYERVNKKWQYTTTIESAFNRSKWGEFGRVLALSGNTLVISALDIQNSDENSDCKDCDFVGVHVYIKENNKWIFQQRITASSMNEYAGFGRSIEYSQFGESIDIDGDTLLVGDSNLTAYQMQNKNKNLVYGLNGGVYVFQRTNNHWEEVSLLSPKEISLEGGFGKSVAIHKNTIVVGGTYEYRTKDEATNRTNYLSFGQFTVFENDKISWKETAHIKFQDLEKNPSEFNRQFASSIDVHNDTIVVGNQLDYHHGIRGNEKIGRYERDIDKLGNVIDKSGSVYVFKKANNKWQMQKKIKPKNSLQLDHFGSSVKIHNKTLIVGAYGESSDASGINNDMNNCRSASSGAVYVFNNKWNSWKQTDYIKASNPSEFDMFGKTIDYEGDTLAVGVSDIYLFLEKMNSKSNNHWKQEATLSK